MKKTYKLPKMFPVFGIMALTAFGAEAAPELNVGAVTGSVGDTVELPITFINDGAVVGMQFDVVLPTGFTAVAPLAKRGAAIPFVEDGLYTLSKSEVGNGVRVIISDQSDPVEPIPSDGGNGLVLVTIPVTIGDGATGENAVSLTGVTLSDISSVAIAPTATDAGSITVDGAGGDVTLTDVTGQTEAAAKTELEALGLTVTTTTASSDTVATGLVISQDPVAGTVAAGSTVALVISTGAESTDVTLTSVVGQTEAAAKTELEALGLTVTTTTASSDTVATGLVISQDPVAGTVAAGSTVALVISTGPSASKVTVPSVGVGAKTEAVATAELEALGLNVTVVESFNQTHAAGLVIGQNPGAGTEVSAGSTVTITVSKGPTGGGGTGGGDGDPTEVVVVTDDDVQAVKDLLVGSTPVTLEQVVQALIAQGFKGVSQLKTTEIVSNLPKGTVLRILGLAAGNVSTSDLTVEVSAGPAGGGAGTAGEPIPTLSFWGLLGLSALMPGIVGWMSKKKKIK